VYPKPTTQQWPPKAEKFDMPMLIEPEMEQRTKKITKGAVS